MATSTTCWYACPLATGSSSSQCLSAVNVGRSDSTSACSAARSPGSTRSGCEPSSWLAMASVYAHTTRLSISRSYRSACAMGCMGGPPDLHLRLFVQQQADCLAERGFHRARDCAVLAIHALRICTKFIDDVDVRTDEDTYDVRWGCGLRTRVLVQETNRTAGD